MYPEMEEDLDLPEPLKPHSLDECQVCGAELAYIGTRLCDNCRATLRDMERKKWWGENGPVAVFFGVAVKKLSMGFLLAGETRADISFPLIQPKKKLLHMEWEWNPTTQRMEVNENPPEEMCWLFWQDCNDRKTKSKVFWGVCNALDYMEVLQAQGHTVTKCGIKIFPLRRGD